MTRTRRRLLHSLPLKPRQLVSPLKPLLRLLPSSKSQVNKSSLPCDSRIGSKSGTCPSSIGDGPYAGSSTRSGSDRTSCSSLSTCSIESFKDEIYLCVVFPLSVGAPGDLHHFLGRLRLEIRVEFLPFYGGLLDYRLALNRRRILYHRRHWLEILLRWAGLWDDDFSPLGKIDLDQRVRLRRHADELSLHKVLEKKLVNLATGAVVARTALPLCADDLGKIGHDLFLDIVELHFIRLYYIFRGSTMLMINGY